MKIALPTNDGEMLSPHFGRSAGFIVFEAEAGRISGRELRVNKPHDESAGQCAGGEDHGADHHSWIARILGDCDLIICAGIGWRAAEALKAAGVKDVLITTPGPAAETVVLYLGGRLPTGGHACSCRH
jgi:predicted Fe-Mo cluster-binding NifX family protein